MKLSYEAANDPDRENDLQLQMGIHQGYIPKDCILGGVVVMAQINKGESPCKGCNLDRKICGSNWPN